MPHVVNDTVAWSVGLFVGLSPSEPCRKFGSDRDTVCVKDSGGPRERPITYGGPLRANTVLCSFNTIQPSSFVSVFYLIKIVLIEKKRKQYSRGLNHSKFCTNRETEHTYRIADRTERFERVKPRPHQKRSWSNIVECYKSNEFFVKVETNWTCSIYFDFVERTKFHEKLVRHCCQNKFDNVASTLLLVRTGL